MKKLLLMAAMLAVAAIIAVPALAQDGERGAEHDGASPGSTVAAAPRDGGADAGHVSFNAAPADGSSATTVPGPDEGSRAGVCSDAAAISLADAPKGSDGGDDVGSVVVAPAPGCSMISIEE